MTLAEQTRKLATEMRRAYQNSMRSYNASCVIDAYRADDWADELDTLAKHIEVLTAEREVYKQHYEYSLNETADDLMMQATEPFIVKQVQTSGPQCTRCQSFTTYARVQAHGLCMKCETEEHNGR